MLVALDLDEVLGDSMQAFVAFHNQNYATDLKLHDFYTYQFEDILNVSPEVGQQRIKQYYKSRYFAEILPVSGAVEGVEELSKEHDLVVVTARHLLIEEQTRAWLNNYFGSRLSKVYFAQSYHRVEGGAKKSEICKEIGAELIVEDCHEYAAECAPVLNQVLLLDRPWNRAQLVDANSQEQSRSKIKRVHNWDEIVGHILVDLPK
jgi:uncharacterized HAD superfamily protein